MWRSLEFVRRRVNNIYLLLYLTFYLTQMKKGDKLVGSRLYLGGFPTADSHQYCFSFLDSEGHRGWSRTYQRGTILPLFLKNIKGDSIMLTNLLNRRVTLGRLILVLLFASGLIFAGTYSGYVVKTEAENSSCCGSDATCFR